ncbi:uncharacterized protein IL334_001900 [Kwoniella shivajii]|uniref:Translation initiation factor 3 N-terminal domain-containing protein n=1 Tax=Kwoniella shivajii TaxID=564305 RepID=A0ABZ1CT74_9TREE|nr:hypothetical protein IL334_001900 [Kwoniella shivajii]
MAPRITTLIRSITTASATSSLQPVITARASSSRERLRFVRQASSSSSSSPSFGLRAPAPEAHPLSYKDASIPYRSVQLVDPATNHLMDPQPLRSILQTYDKSTHTLVLVNIDRETPIVKLINKVEERKKERESEEKIRLKKRMSIEEKEVQVSWQSAKGDLSHKLELAKSLLEKGDRVQIVFANRKKSESISDPKKQEIISSFDTELDGVVGKKWKDDDKNKGLWILYYNPLESTRNQVQSKVKDQELAKRKEKEEKKEARRKKEEERRLKAEARAAAAADENSSLA